MSLIDSISVDSLRALSQDVSSDTHNSGIRLKTLRELLSKHVSVEAQARSLLRFIIAFAEQLESGVISNLTATIERVFEDDIAQFPGLPEKKDLISAIIQSNLLRNIAKSRRLSAEFSNFIADSTVVVDMRPIFDDSRENIIGNVIYSTLNISYHSSDRSVHDRSFVLDEADILHLAKSLEKAVLKIKSLRRFHEQNLAGECIILGDRDEYGML